MPRVFDNIDQSLKPALCNSLEQALRADFCVGYFNLRGWRHLHHCIETWSGEDDNCCRLLVGMHMSPSEELAQALSISGDGQELDNQIAVRLKKRLAEEFRDQLARGAPTDADEAGLRRLAKQIRSRKVRVKLFLRYQLHAKLYLCFRDDPDNPITGYVGSSNLTFAGLSKQGELNIDVLDHDACDKLAKWFEDRWMNHWCIDISEELAQIIDESWAREQAIPPYHIYVYMAYHLSQEARAGITEFHLPKEFKGKLFAFQEAAVKIAAHHLHKREGVLIGDVVGLGKTLMATALARIFEDDFGLETLIICPKNLVPMWDEYVYTYRLRAKVLSISRVLSDLAGLRRYRLVIIDESHNLRNREGRRYQAIREYITENESRVVLLTATPYNKTYLDLSNQLRLFVPEGRDLGIRPEALLREIGEQEFTRRHQASVRSLAAFEKSPYPDDWRELMRLFMVRRTRSFVKENYAYTDKGNGRKYLKFEDGSRSYFPDRIPRTLTFEPDEHYRGLSSQEVVDIINGLHLPRYGLGNYVAPSPDTPPTSREAEQLSNLSRAGKRLMGFCRVNLFKRLESSGVAFIQSIERHVLRNYVYLHAIDEGKPLPIGTQDATWFDARYTDEDADARETSGLFEDRDEDTAIVAEHSASLSTKDLRRRAAEIYRSYETQRRSSFQWISSGLFIPALAQQLRADADALLGLLRQYGQWSADRDAKLRALQELLFNTHPNEKILVFTQFADTVRYLDTELRRMGLDRTAGVTGDNDDPTSFAYRFSPVSNAKRDKITSQEELRVLIATDVLSEGQNLQDCAIVVNYDLPWAIIRLVQRAGRIDRIGQQAEEIQCYTFWPSDGVEKVLSLRSRVRQRLQENAEVVGTDESFFEDDANDTAIIDLYNEKTGILDGDVDDEVDLASYAYQVWKNAIDRDPSLEQTISSMPPVVFSTRPHEATDTAPEGVLLYMRTGDGSDALTWVNRKGQIVTESQRAILRAAACEPATPALARHPNHHDLVRTGVEHVLQEERDIGGGLGRPSGARYRTYERLKNYALEIEGTLLDIPELARTITEIYQNPLTAEARDILNRQLRSGIDDQKLAKVVLALRDEDRLCISQVRGERHEPQIICSMGLKDERENEK